MTSNTNLAEIVDRLRVRTRPSYGYQPLMDEAADAIEHLQGERDHFYKQWRSCWAPLTPRSEDEKRGLERVLAILKSKLSDGGGIVGVSDVQRAHNDYYRGRRLAFEECAAMLRLALEAESPSPQSRATGTPTTAQGSPRSGKL
ncbi:hypothetical protein AAIH70_11445 [Neorhizobium sp. BT27B]|uniref:hypothetical protein n=1 Tax=Neorhizobium sp. BT27B TaxID=3142625 RepID=UPI003D2CDFE1